jgi:hypothetical protein
VTTVSPAQKPIGYSVHLFLVAMVRVRLPADCFASNDKLLETLNFIVETIDSVVVGPLGAHLVEYRNDFFLLTLQLSSKRNYSRLAPRLVQNLVMASEIFENRFSPASINNNNKNSGDHLGCSSDSVPFLGSTSNSANNNNLKGSSSTFLAATAIANNNTNANNSKNHFVNPVWLTAGLSLQYAFPLRHQQQNSGDHKNDNASSVSSALRPLSVIGAVFSRALRNERMIHNLVFGNFVRRKNRAKAMNSLPQTKNLMTANASTILAAVDNNSNNKPNSVDAPNLTPKKLNHGKSDPIGFSVVREHSSYNNNNNNNETEAAANQTNSESLPNTAELSATTTKVIKVQKQSSSSAKSVMKVANDKNNPINNSQAGSLLPHQTQAVDDEDAANKAAESHRQQQQHPSNSITSHSASLEATTPATANSGYNNNNSKKRGVDTSTTAQSLKTVDSSNNNNSATVVSNQKHQAPPIPTISNLPLPHAICYEITTHQALHFTALLIDEEGTLKSLNRKTAPPDFVMKNLPTVVRLISTSQSSMMIVQKQQLLEADLAKQQNNNNNIENNNQRPAAGSRLRVAPVSWPSLLLDAASALPFCKHQNRFGVSSGGSNTDESSLMHLGDTNNNNNSPMNAKDEDLVDFAP